MLIFAVIFSLLATSCASPRRDERILGGAEADLVDFPFSLSIEWMDYGHYCAAAIISTEWALLDAYCTWDPADTTSFIVRVGSATVGKGEIHNVAKWIFHPLANITTSEYDFALIKIDPPFVFSENISAAALPEQNQATPDGAIGLVSGWGQIDPNEIEQTFRQLQYANLTLASEANCATLLGDGYRDSILCAQGENNEVAVCWRDEGGPLVLDGTLFGITLWPRGPCANPMNVQKFARVASVRDWIDATIAAN